MESPRQTFEHQLHNSRLLGEAPQQQRLMLPRLQALHLFAEFHPAGDSQGSF
jgi:hypothetical protein